jgi:hypothetical protein
MSRTLSPFPARRRALSGLAALTLSVTGLLGLTGVTTPAEATSTKVKSLPAMVLDAPEAPVAPGAAFNVRVLFAGSVSGTVRYSLSGLPLGTRATLTVKSSRERTLRVTIPAGAPPGLYEAVFRTLNPGTKRSDSFLVNVNPPVTIPPTAPPTVPVPTQPQVRPEFQIATPETTKLVRLGGSVSFPISITRQNGWQGPVRLVLEGLPAGASAGFLPFNPTSDPSSELRLVVPATVPPGDYTLRVTASADPVVRQLNLTLKIRGTEGVSLLVASGGNAEVGRTDRIGELEVTVVNGDGGLVTMTAEGLPTGVTISYGQNPLLGRTPINATVAAGTPVGTYNFFLVARKGDAVTKMPATVKVIASTAPTLRYTVTPVTFPPGEPVSFGLAANVVSVVLPRGNSVQISVTVSPKGGFALPIDFTASGIPSGVTAVLEPTATPNVVRLTLTAPASQATGASTVLIRGASGSLVGPIGVALTIS